VQFADEYRGVYGFSGEWGRSERTGERYIAELTLQGQYDASILASLKRFRVAALEIHADGGESRGFEQLAEFHRGIRSITLTGQSVSDADMKSISATPSLKTLTLQDVSVGDEGLPDLYDAKWLEQVRVEHTRVTEEGLRSLAQRISDRFKAEDYGYLNPAGPPRAIGAYATWDPEEHCGQIELVWRDPLNGLPVGLLEQRLAEEAYARRAQASQ
jgi:hypothetical protein